MKSNILVLAILAFVSVSVFGQSSDQIRNEANTDYVYTPDNSLYAKLWQQQVDARKSGDMETYNRYQNRSLKAAPINLHRERRLHRICSV